MPESEIKSHILVIDDNKEIAELLQKFLTKKNYRVTTAFNGTEGLEKFKKDKPILVLLDINMPGMDGIETLKEIKKLDSRVGVMMITGVQEEDIAKKCLQLGAADYITKPLDLDYLELTVLAKIFLLIH